MELGGTDVSYHPDYPRQDAYPTLSVWYDDRQGAPAGMQARRPSPHSGLPAFPSPSIPSPPASTSPFPHQQSVSAATTGQGQPHDPSARYSPIRYIRRDSEVLGSLPAKPGANAAAAPQRQRHRSDAQPSFDSDKPGSPSFSPHQPAMNHGFSSSSSSSSEPNSAVDPTFPSYPDYSSQRGYSYEASTISHEHHHHHHHQQQLPSYSSYPLEGFQRQQSVYLPNPQQQQQASPQPPPPHMSNYRHYHQMPTGCYFIKDEDT